MTIGASECIARQTLYVSGINSSNPTDGHSVNSMQLELLNQMTEDDTFKVLCRQPFHIASQAMLEAGMRHQPSRDQDAFLKSMGWKYGDYCAAYYEANKAALGRLYKFSGKTEYVKWAVDEHTRLIINERG